MNHYVVQPETYNMYVNYTSIKKKKKRRPNLKKNLWMDFTGAAQWTKYGKGGKEVTADFPF